MLNNNNLNNNNNKNGNLIRVINSNASVCSNASSITTSSVSSSFISSNSKKMNQSNLKYVNFQSTNNINKFSNHKEMFTNSFNLNPNIKESIALSSIKFRRSGSVSTLLPSENASSTANNKLNNSNNTTTNVLITTISPISITGTFNNSLPNFTNNNMLRNNFKSNFAPIHSKRHKVSNLTLIDYCNIINLNTNFLMLTNYYQELDDPNSRLTLKTNRNGNIQKQVSIAEQMAILFGSTMCTCYLCKMKTAKNTKRNQRHHFEISPIKNNMDYTIIRYTYSSPYSQISALKLFNIMNTDCSIYFSAESNSSKLNFNASITSNSTSFNSTNTIIPNIPQANSINNISNTSNPQISCNATTYPLYSYNPFTTTIISTCGNLVSNSASINNNTSNNNYNVNNNSNHNGNNNNPSNGLTLKNLMHVNTNAPPMYDSRYLYLIDCRLGKKKFNKHRIYTAIHYSDLLNDTVYLSPPTENYTLIVLYDENGQLLTQNSNVNSSDSAFENEDDDDYNEDYYLNKKSMKREELVPIIRSKLNCTQNQTIYILSGGYEEFYNKFPYMCSDIDIRSTVDRNKYLTIYPNCVVENQMFIGSGIQAKNWKIIRDLNITHIINCSIEHECVFEQEINYLHVKLEDNQQENIYKFLIKALRFIEDAFEKYYEEIYKLSENSTDFSVDSGIHSATSSKSSNIMNTMNKPNNINIRQPVFLVHCNLGISRSSSILIAYLISKYRLCLYSAFKYVKDKRLQIAPNYSFLKQLKQFEDTVF